MVRPRLRCGGDYEDIVCTECGRVAGQIKLQSIVTIITMVIRVASPPGEYASSILESIITIVIRVASASGSRFARRPRQY